MRKQPNSRDCFVCGLGNAAGLKVTFYDTADAKGQPTTVARFTGAHQHQGYPGRMHGGLVAGILDETIGRAINASRADGEATVWGVAVDLQVRYAQPVPLDVELTARGRITREHRRLFDGEGELLLPDGSVAASARARYARLPLEAISELDPESLGWRVYPDEE